MSSLTLFRLRDEIPDKEAIEVPQDNPSQPQPTKSMPWPVIWAMIAFLSGTLFSAGMGWGHSSTSLDNIALSISRLEGEVGTLSDKYTMTDKAVGQELQKIEDHLSYDDTRLDKLESSRH